MKNKISNTVLMIMTTCLLIVVSFISYPVHIYASDGEEYITITVDAVDDSKMKYALDSDDLNAFGDSNEFRVPAGTSHTIYVKDEAGNITSQQYEPEAESFKEEDIEEHEDTRNINIDLELGNVETDDEYDLVGEATEAGAASVASKIKTDGSDDAEKVFYTFTTKEGETLYLVIDQGQGADNVYLLDTVSLTDLRVLADEQASSYDNEKENEEDNLLSILNDNDTDDVAIAEPEKAKSKTSSRGNGMIILILAAIGGGAYYYIKIYRNKKDEAMDVMDAMDLDEFEPEGEEEEIEFDYDDAEKERYLEQLLNGEEEESFYDTDPEDYATSHTEESEERADEGGDDSGDEDLFGDIEVDF